MRPHVREWRNWQTRWLQVPVLARVWGFKSPLAHHHDDGESGYPGSRLAWATITAMRLPSAVTAVVLTFLLVGCAASDAPDAPSVSPTVSETPASQADCPSTAPPHDGAEFDQALHDELIAMFERDQAGRLGTAPDNEGDGTRTERLREIIAEHGWPTYDLVGEDGEDAAWTIAQHSDLDPDFQRCALEHLRIAVDAGQGSPGNLAYLEDRIAAAAGEPQRYGTQIGCGPDGPQPATPLLDAGRIDEVRASVGLPPYEEYLAEMAAVCAETG